MSRVTILSGVVLVAIFFVSVSSLSAQHTVYSLATNQAVQKELGVTDEQKPKLQVLYREEYDLAVEMDMDIPTILVASADERKSAYAEKTKKLDAKFLPRLKEILTSEQFERLVQLQYQTQETEIYSNPVVVDTLELTKEQQEKIAAINTHSQKKQASFKGRSRSGEAARATFTQEREAALANVLTAEQTQRMNRLRGKIFDHLPPRRNPIDEQKDEAERLSRLLESPAILEELKVNDGVAAELKESQTEQQQQNRKFRDEESREYRATRDLPVGKRAEKMRTIAASYAKKRASDELIAARRIALLTEPQLKRLRQLDIQDSGVDALFSKDVSSALKLTSEQKARILDICVIYGPKFEPFLVGVFRDPENSLVRSTLQEVVPLVKERAALIDQVLGKEQLERLAELRGKPFELSRLSLARRVPIIVGLLPNPLPPASQNLLQMVSREAVRKDLKLSPEEDAAIVALLAKLEKGGEDLNKAAEAGAQPPPEGWLQRIENLKQGCVEEINKVLKEAHKTRLDQINLQRDWRSLRSGLGPKNVLELTGEQLRKMASIEAETRQKRTAARGGGFAGPPGNRALRQEIDAKGQAQLLEVLTPEQLVKLKELQGPPFDVSIFDPLAQLPRPAVANGRDPLEAKFDQSVIDYVNGTILREQDTNGDGTLDKSEWVRGKWSAANPPENSDLNKDGKLSREELCLRVSKRRGIPIKGEQPPTLPDSSK